MARSDCRRVISISSVPIQSRNWVTAIVNCARRGA
jgi:hypothetical protein